jgi:hypothetical protein
MNDVDQFPVTDTVGDGQELAALGFEEGRRRYLFSRCLNELQPEGSGKMERTWGSGCSRNRATVTPGSCTAAFCLPVVAAPIPLPRHRGKTSSSASSRRASAAV